MSRAYAQVYRRLDLLAIRTDALREYCRNLGLSDSGTREELVERLHREIWRKAHD